MRTIKNILFVMALAVSATYQLHASTIVISTNEFKNDARNVAEKYSLKNLGSLTHKTSTFYTLKSSLEFKGINTHASVNANYLKYNKGNISYVIPYRYKLVLTRFKTPTAIQP
jgi:hypothetical protein